MGCSTTRGMYARGQVRPDHRGQTNAWFDRPPPQYFGPGRGGGTDSDNRRSCSTSCVPSHHPIHGTVFTQECVGVPGCGGSCVGAGLGGLWWSVPRPSGLVSRKGDPAWAKAFEQSAERLNCWSLFGQFVTKRLFVRQARSARPSTDWFAFRSYISVCAPIGTHRLA